MSWVRAKLPLEMSRKQSSISLEALQYSKKFPILWAYATLTRRWFLRTKYTDNEVSNSILNNKHKISCRNHILDDGQQRQSFGALAKI